MIQDILPEHFYNQYQKREPGPDSRILLVSENGIYMKDALTESGAGDSQSLGDMQDFPACREFLTLCKAAGLQAPRTVYLFSLDRESYFLVVSPETVAGIPQYAREYGIRPVSMTGVRALRPRKRVLAAATAWHLFRWYKDNRFCGRCGGMTRHSETLRMLECPACGNQIFPKIAPAVIVGVTDGERILMTKYANRAYKRYALIAGFTEIGETAEETVRREVMEEVGLQVKNIRYYKSQPWGFDSNLLLGFFCELDGEDGIALDTEELAAADWVDWRDIPDDEEGLSLTREMMTVFRENCRKNTAFS